jgi:hypothetical protein
MTNPAQKKLISREKDEQAAVVCWLRMKGIPHIAHMTGVNLHGNFALMNTLKQVGCLQKGVPDLFICAPVGRAHGLWIEMKKEKGGFLSPEQVNWLRARERDEYAIAVCHGADEAIKIITQYLEGKPHA